MLIAKVHTGETWSDPYTDCFESLEEIEIVKRHTGWHIEVEVEEKPENVIEMPFGPGTPLDSMLGVQMAAHSCLVKAGSDEVQFMLQIQPNGDYVSFFYDGDRITVEAEEVTGPETENFCERYSGRRFRTQVALAKWLANNQGLPYEEVLTAMM